MQQKQKILENSARKKWFLEKKLRQIKQKLAAGFFCQIHDFSKLCDVEERFAVLSNQ